MTDDTLPPNLVSVKSLIRAIIDDAIARKQTKPKSRKQFASYEQYMAEQESLAKHLRSKIDDVAQQRRIPWSRVQEFTDEVSGYLGTPLTKLTISQLRLVLRQVKERR
jgi:hypothetical protein